MPPPPGGALKRATSEAVVSAPPGPPPAGNAGCTPPFVCIWEELLGNPTLGGNGGVVQAPHSGTGSDMQHFLWGPSQLCLSDSSWECSQGRPGPPVGGMGEVEGREGLLRSLGNPGKLQ